MSVGDCGAGLNRGSDEHLLYAGMGLTYLVAAIHLFHPSNGFPRLVQLAVVGSVDLLLADPRPLAFTLAAFLLIVGANLALANYRRRLLYALGMVLVATFIVGYLAWHYTGHGGFLPGREPVLHGLGPIENVVSHLTGDLVAAVSKALEVVLLAVLWVLFQREGEPSSGTEPAE
jgi:hypothetical protein